MNPDLKKYVDESKASGKTEDVIRHELLGAGWSEEDISKALAGQTQNISGEKVAKFTTKNRPHRILVVFLIIAIISAGFMAYRYVSDRLQVKNVQKHLMWIEDYYTQNDYYPTKEEFLANFRNASVGYNAVGDTPFMYTFTYDLFARRSFALGEQHSGIFGFYGPFYVDPCRRWGSMVAGVFQYFGSIPGTQIDGGIRVDFSKGEVYFQYIDNLHRDPNLVDKKVILLTGLVHPRLLDSKEGEVVVTNGKNIYKYETDFYIDHLELKNPQIIGTVPTGCPSDYLNMLKK